MSEPADRQPRHEPLPPRAWLQFGVRSLMILVAVCAVVLGLAHYPVAALVLLVFGWVILAMAPSARSTSDILVIVILAIVFALCLWGASSMR